MQKSASGKIMGYVIPVVITIGLCWIMFRNIDFNDMLDIIRDQCDFTYIGIALALSAFSNVLRSLRWRIQLRALGIKVSVWILTLSYFGTYAVNLVFPRLGEIWRSGYIAHRQHSQFSTVFGSMVAERVADFVTVLVLLLATMCLAAGTIIDYIQQNSSSYQWLLNLASSPFVWLAAAIGIAAAWWLLTRKASRKSILGKLQSFVKGLWDGFAIIARMRGKFSWVVYCMLIWGCYFVQMYVAFYAFPFTRDVLAQYGVTAALVTFILSSLAMGVPSNGGIGPWQWAVIFALGIYGVSDTNAGAFANLVLGSQTVMLIVLGIFTFIMIAIDKNKHRK